MVWSRSVIGQYINLTSRRARSHKLSYLSSFELKFQQLVISIAPLFSFFCVDIENCKHDVISIRNVDVITENFDLRKDSMRDASVQSSKRSWMISLYSRRARPNYRFAREIDVQIARELMEIRWCEKARAGLNEFSHPEQNCSDCRFSADILKTDAIVSVVTARISLWLFS